MEKVTEPWRNVDPPGKTRKRLELDWGRLGGDWGKTGARLEGRLRGRQLDSEKREKLIRRNLKSPMNSWFWGTFFGLATS